jgi:outer membrane protein assembly factor BamB
MSGVTGNAPSSPHLRKKAAGLLVPAYVVVTLMLFSLEGPTVAIAQTLSATTPTITPTTTTAKLIEWDISALYNNNTNVDAQPGAVAVDRNQDGWSSGLWFVTRAFDFRVIRLQSGKAAKTGMAQWTSWQLDSSGLTTGGVKRVKPSDDGRVVFVRTLFELQRVDTENCTTTVDPLTMATTTTCNLTLYQDGNLAMISDLALDRGGNVYTAIFDGTDSWIEKLIPSTAYVTRWKVGGGAGICNGGLFGADPCLAGIAVHQIAAQVDPTLVYYSEPDTNSIGELNTTTNGVRRWSLTTAFPADTVQQPRQVNIDDDGLVWVVTGSGHLISLDPNKNRLTMHPIPGGVTNGPFGVAPDGGFVGYTASEPANSKVGMLVPRGQSVKCSSFPCLTSNSLIPMHPTVTATCVHARRDSGQVSPNPKTVNATITSQSDGTYVEALINTNGNDSQMPLGIAPHPGKAVGNFFYAVGQTANLTIDRVGLARLPRPQAHHEREDKDDFDDGSMHDDQDHDGIPNQHESSDSSAKLTRENTQLSAGQANDYVLPADSNTNMLIASTQADDPTVPVSVEIIDPNGISVALPVPTPGLAVASFVPTAPGNYTVRIKNWGLVPVNQETLLIQRIPAPLP